MYVQEIINRLNMARYSIYGSIVMEIGHEINNHLNSISLASQIIDLYNKNDNKSDIDQKLEIINHNIESIQNFTQKMISIKSTLKASDFSKERWDLVSPLAVIRDNVSVFGGINRFDKLNISFDSISPDFYIYTNTDIFDLIISVILLDSSIIVRHGEITFASRRENDTKSLLITASCEDSSISLNNLFFDEDIRILNDHLIISLKLIENTLSLCNASMNVDDEGENLSAIRIIYS